MSSGSGVSTIVVTALDGTTTKTYTVNYTVEPGDSVDEATTAKVEKSAQYYTPAGIAVPATAKGLMLKKITYADGSVKVEKVVK